MSKKLYHVRLNPEEREQVERFVTQGKKSARAMNRARMLLLADKQQTDEEIRESLGVCRATVHNIRKK